MGVWQGMDAGTKASAIGHAALILWVLLGDFLWPFDTSTQPEVANVSLMSEADFAALQASAPAPAQPAPAQPALVPSEPPADLPADLPVADQAQPDEAPPPTAPIAEVEQPIPVPLSQQPPAPRPMDRVAATPVNEQPDTPDLADVATPETSTDAAPDAQVVQTPQPAAAPEEAAPMVVTEADPPPQDAPQLAPTASSRPKARPPRPSETVADAPAETPTETPPPNNADAAAIAAALAEAVGQDSAPAADLPQGPPMTGGEVEGLRIAINRCWVTSTLSTEAMNTTVTLRVEMSEAGKPLSIEMTDFSGGSRAAADRAFEAGRRAVLRCAGANGYDLPADKYGQWNVLNLIFDPNGMRLR